MQFLHKCTAKSLLARNHCYAYVCIVDIALQHLPLFGHTSKEKDCSHEQLLASLRREASLYKLARNFGSWRFFIEPNPQWVLAAQCDVFPTVDLDCSSAPPPL